MAPPAGPGAPGETSGILAGIAHITRDLSKPRGIYPNHAAFTQISRGLPQFIRLFLGRVFFRVKNGENGEIPNPNFGRGLRGVQGWGT